MRGPLNRTDTGGRSHALALGATYPYWTALPYRELPVAQRPASRSYDVVIVGAGLTGALAAEALSDGRRSVLVVDRRMPLAGSTSASAALILSELDAPLTALSASIGQERAERLWHRSATAVEKLLSLIARLGIDCGLSTRKSLYLAGDRMDAEAMAAEARARNLTGLRSQFIPRDALMAQYGIDRPAALLSSMAAALNPVQLTAGLLAAVARRGGEIVANTEVLDARQSGGRIHLLTSDGDFLSAGHVIFCTGYDIPDGLQPHESQIMSTWAIASEAGCARPRWLDASLLREASAHGLHIRTTPDGRILARGEEEPDPFAYHAPDKLAEKTARLADRVSTLIGMDIGKPEHAWSGAFGTTPLGLPVIGEIPGLPQAWAILGYGSNGMTFSQIAADIVLAAIHGRDDPDGMLFSYPEGSLNRMPA